MSETLNAPWIADYLIDIAETYGCKLSSAPVQHKPGRKVQILQFLTFRQFEEDDCIWAYVSDKHQQIPVRFSRYAIAEYDKANQPDSQGKRLTQHRSAIATIKSFKPIFQRIPTGTVGKMTVLENLALNVDHVQIFGSAGEPEFGSPRILEAHDDIKQWMEGLRAGDGSGNVLKLRKEKKIAQEREENFVTEMLVAHEGRENRSGQQTLPKNDTVLSDRRAYAEQDDWRETIAKKPLQYYKRPTGTSVKAKSIPTGLGKKHGSPAPPVRQNFNPVKGALDLHSSPVISQATDIGNPPRSERQTTPSEWPGSPERYEAAEEPPNSLPSTPPLLTPEQPQEVPGQSVRVPKPAVIHHPQATLVVVQQTISNDLKPTSPKRPSQAESRCQSLPSPSSSSAFSSALVTTNLQNRATSLPSGLFKSSVSHARRVPPPLVKNTKEACGEILVPASDSGGQGTSSSSHENGSSLGRQGARIAVGPGHVTASSEIGSSLRRVNDTNNEQSPVVEPGPRQELDKAPLDEPSSMSLNGYYQDHHGNGVQTRNGAGNNKKEAVELGRPSPGPKLSCGSLPPSSPPIHSQSPNWHSSMALVEETAVMNENPNQVTAQQDPPTLAAKRTRPLTTSPPESKRPRLMSREPVRPSLRVHDAIPRKVFDAELLSLGIEVDLGDYDDNPPPYPWGKGISRLNLKPTDRPLLITNSKLAEIWESVCESRGWSKK